MAGSAASAGPLRGLKCLVCGTHEARPIEEKIIRLGAEVVVVQRGVKTVPDVIITDSASAHRLQMVIEMHSQIPVVTSSWVSGCVSTGQRLPYEEYRLLAMTGCQVSFTNFPKKRRAVFQPRIEALGGVVVADMNRRCTHLVVGSVSPESEKLRAAVSWHVPIVSAQWLEDTLHDERVMPLVKYKVQVTFAPASSSGKSAQDATTSTKQAGSYLGTSLNSTDKGSEPAKRTCRAGNAHKPSQEITGPMSAEHNRDGAGGAQPGPATAALAASGTRSLPTVPLSARGPGHDRSSGHCAGPTSSQSQRAGSMVASQASLFDHRRLFLAGLSAGENDAVAGIIRRNPGCRRLTLDAYVTHVVVGSAPRKDRARILEFAENHEGRVVYLQWLLESDRTQELADEDAYAVDLSSWRAACEGHVPASQSQGVLAGYHLCIDALESETELRQAREHIRTLGGQMLTDGTKDLVRDWSKVYALCPMSFTGADAQRISSRSRIFSKIEEGHWATVFWLSICRASASWMNPSVTSVFQPIRHTIPFPDFEGKCILVGGFGDGARRGVMHVITAMGAECWESVREHQWSHISALVTPKAAGKKFRVCFNKKIPCVAPNWLTACMTRGCFASPDEFLWQAEAPTSLMTQDRAGPDCVDATQTQARPQFISQGGLQRRPRARPVRAMDDNSLSRHNSNSILQQLSQNLSAAPDKPGDCAPVDFGDLTKIIPQVSSAPHPTFASTSKPPLPSAPVQTSAGMDLRSFAASHGVAPSSILGSTKRPSTADEAQQAKRPCSGSQTAAAQDPNKLVADPVLAGMSAARGSAAPQSTSLLGSLAVELGNYNGSQALESQQAAEASQLPFASVRAPAMTHAVAEDSSERSREQAAAARRRRHRRTACQDPSKVDSWSLQQETNDTGPQALFSQRVQFLPSKDAD